MKRIIILLGVVLAVVFTVIGVSKEQNMNATSDVSNGLCVIASKTEMAKSALVNKKIVFSADDFEKYLNLSEISTITITSVPSINDGCLCLGNAVVNSGQTISRENISLLSYRPSGKDVKQTSFTFKANSQEYEMTCNLYFLAYENSAPTLAMENNRSFEASTHQRVAIYNKIGAYDPDGDDVRYEIVTYAKNGVLKFDGQTGEYVYTPIGLYFGEDYFEYVAVDKYGNYSPSKRVNLNVEKLKTDTKYCDMDDHPSHHAALTMTEKGIMNGVSIGDKTYFMPDRAVSRIDFLVMLMHSLNIDASQNVFDTGFDDDNEIPQSLKGYVHTARKMGLISGAVDAMGNYYFYPNREITRAEAALVVSNLVDKNVPTVKPTFADKDDIPTWAHDAIYILNDLGILCSVNGSFSPSAPMTRAQSAEMLYALMYYLK